MHEQTLNHGTLAGTEAETRTRIRTAAARVFAERGYNDATIEEVCSEAGIEPAAFAEHYADKYALFKDVVFAPTLQMLRATDGIETNDPHQARGVLLTVLDKVAAVAIATRATGGFYRSEHRYLTREDGSELSQTIARLRDRVRAPLMLHRPNLSYDDAEILTAAALSALVSITVHATPLPAPKVQTLLTVTARRLLDSEPASHSEQDGDPASVPEWHSDTSDTGRILNAAVGLCFARGYRGVTLEDVAERAGLPVASVTARYRSLSDLLAEGCLRGYASLDRDMTRAIETTTTARDRLLALCRAYVRHYVLDYKLMTIYLADARNFDDANRTTMLELQHKTIAMWTQAIQDARPELSSTESTFLVFAAISLVSDLARITKWNSEPAITNKIEKCASMVMALIR